MLYAREYRQRSQRPPASAVGKKVLSAVLVGPVPPPLNREAESEAISDFLEVSCTQSAGLLLAGEPGIGKTTMWLAAIEQARNRGMHVLSARAAAAESVMAYVSVADLLAGIGPELLATLPAPQRLAVDRVLLHVDDGGEATDPRAVAAAFLSLITALSASAPTILAIDDLQWLDPSSARVLAFTARRLTGPAGLLATVRSSTTDDSGVPWLQLHRPDAIRQIRLGPFTISGLRQIMSTEYGISLPRRAMVRIHEVSGGNPFYAIELARAATEHNFDELALPTTLSGLVKDKIADLGPDVREVLLAMSCLAAPTVALVAQAVGVDPDSCGELLSAAEKRGIVIREGARVRFAHPLLSTGVYSDASLIDRRAMHRRLAAVVGNAELRARHLALAASKSDAVTIDALDAAAELAVVRGAPAAAAEFMELAINLGEDTPGRYIRCATYHFNAGDAESARIWLGHVLDAAGSADARAEALRLLGLWSVLDGSSRLAVELLEQARASGSDNDALLVQILVPLAFARVNVHDLAGAGAAADQAVVTASLLNRPDLLSQALGMQATVRFLLGDGPDEAAMRRAVELEDLNAPGSALLSPTMLQAALLCGTGQFDEAKRTLSGIERRYADRGHDSELMVVSFHNALTAIWRGDYVEAAAIGDDTIIRAQQLESDLPLSIGWMIRSAVAAHTGDEALARQDAERALTACKRCDSPWLIAVWPLTTLGFLEVSLGNYQGALVILQPLLDIGATAPRATEIYLTPYAPDAAEALIRVNRLDEADMLISRLEDNGRRLDRPWMLAVGGRCRAMLQASRHDLDGALITVQHAIAEHDRLSMPFERARTQLLMGELQRRQRARVAATATLRAAAASFADLNTPLWARRAQSTLDRIAFGSRDSGALTPTEFRIAELVAAGQSNQDVASTLFISAKTVEVHLTRVYRKLGIRSRAELGRRLDHLAES